MTGRPRPAARFRIAPVGPGGAAWEAALDVVLAPIHLSKPVHVLLPGRPPGGGR